MSLQKPHYHRVQAPPSTLLPDQPSTSALGNFSKSIWDNIKKQLEFGRPKTRLIDNNSNNTSM